MRTDKIVWTNRQRNNATTVTSTKSTFSYVANKRAKVSFSAKARYVIQSFSEMLNFEEEEEEEEEEEKKIGFICEENHKFSADG